MAKGKSLLSQTSKPKRVTKYDETDKKPKTNYEFELNQTVVYLGNMGNYNQCECEITKRSKRHISENYKIKFEDDNEIEVNGNFLKNLEDFQLWLLEQNKEINEDVHNGMSDEEIKIRANGLEPMKNFKSCHNQLKLVVEKSCETCGHVNRCIYRGKYQYDKVKC